MNTEILICICIWAGSLLINLINGIVENWNSIHTIGDFLWPLPEDDNFLIIYFPLTNTVVTLLLLISWIYYGLVWLFNIKIKK